MEIGGCAGAGMAADYSIQKGFSSIRVFAASRENLFNMINYISFNFFIRCFFFFINFIIFFIFHSKHCFHILIISFAERPRKTGSFEWGVGEAFGVMCS